jgi:hypothetical protein
MWLKLNAVIDWAAYPEQSLPQNDGRGYEPYPDGGTKNYNGVDIAFRKETFHAPYVTLFDKLTAELASGRFVVVSLRPPGNAGWHGYLVTEKDGGDFVVFSKNGPTEKDTVEDRLSNRLSTREKVDCLFMEIVKTVRP